MVVMTKTVNQARVKDAPYMDSRKYSRKAELKQAQEDFSDLSEIHDKSTFELMSLKDFLNTNIVVLARYFGELISGKRLKQAEEALHREEMLFLEARRMYELTGEKPGAKSGVVKNQTIAERKSANVKIAAAMVLAYSKDDAQKKQLMLDVKRKYPELVEDIKVLAKKAKARREFKNAIASINLGQQRSVNKSVVSKRSR